MVTMKILLDLGLVLCVYLLATSHLSDVSLDALTVWLYLVDLLDDLRLLHQLVEERGSL